MVTFDARQQNQRAGLTLVNGAVYIAWASHEDRAPYYGWIAGYTYNGSSFAQATILNATPNDRLWRHLDERRRPSGRLQR